MKRGPQPKRLFNAAQCRARAKLALSIARVVTDHILVLNRGRIVERGETKHVLQHPEDDYTKRLLDAVATPFATQPSAATVGAPAVTTAT